MQLYLLKVIYIINYLTKSLDFNGGQIKYIEIMMSLSFNLVTQYLLSILYKKCIILDILRGFYISIIHYYVC